MKRQQIILLLLPLLLFCFGATSQVNIMGSSDTIYYNEGDNFVVRVGKVYVRNIVSINAADYGFHPHSSSSENTTAWYSMPNADTVDICGDGGTFLIDSTLYLNSNTVYRFCNGDTIKKDTESASFTSDIYEQRSINRIEKYWY